MHVQERPLVDKSEVAEGGIKAVEAEVMESFANSSSKWCENE